MADRHLHGSTQIDTLTDGGSSATVSTILTKVNAAISASDVKTLNTNNSTAQSVSSSESLTGSGSIKLHKISKTGSYDDLLNKPSIPTSLGDLTGRTTDLLSEPGTVYGTTITQGPAVHEQLGNRFYGIPANRIVIEDSQDAGATWTVRTSSEYIKQSLFDSSVHGGFTVGKNAQGNRSCQCITRVTCALGNFGTAADEAPDDQKIALWNSTNFVTCPLYCTCEKLYYWVGGPDYVDITCQTAPAPAAGSAPVFTTKSTLSLARGWNGGNTSTVEHFVLGGGSTQAPIIRFIFRVNCADGSYDDSKLEQSLLSDNYYILDIRGFSKDIWGYSHPMQLWDKPYEMAAGSYDWSTWYAGLIPDSTYSYRMIGTMNNKWCHLYLSGHIVCDSLKYTVDESEYLHCWYNNIAAYKTFSPSSNNSLDLGTSGEKWRNLYLANNLTDGTNSISVASIVGKQDTLISGTTIKTINNQSILGSGNISVGGGEGGSYYTKSSNLIPDNTNTYDIGSSSSKFKDAYFQGNINVGTTGVSKIYEVGNQLRLYGNDYVMLLNKSGSHNYCAYGLSPTVSNTEDLGKVGYLWRDIYLSGQVKTDGGIATTTDGSATSIGMKFWKGTQAQYDSITTKDSNTFYVIVG